MDEVEGKPKAAPGMQGAIAASQSVVATQRAPDSQALLLFKVDGDEPKAVPLSLIVRLENIDRTTIERSGTSLLLQYRGKLMPLISLKESAVLEKEGAQPLLVIADRDKNMGLLVDDIIDIVEDRLQIDVSSRRPGYLGKAIVAGRATDILDAAYYLAQVPDDRFGAGTGKVSSTKVSCRVLLVDDSPFFRNLLTPLLTVAGYIVTAVENPIEALKLQDAGKDFDVIVSDIEMPQMNGFEFVAALRKGGRWSRLPVVAMSSHATPRDLDRGRQAGFSDYVAKFDREALLASLERVA